MNLSSVLKYRVVALCFGFCSLMQVSFSSSAYAQWPAFDHDNPEFLLLSNDTGNNDTSDSQDWDVDQSEEDLWMCSYVTSDIPFTYYVTTHESRDASPNRRKVTPPPKA